MSADTCNPTCKIFKSVGTIHIQMDKTGNLMKLFLTPNCEHSASDGGKKYAVFFPTCKCTKNGKTTQLCDKGVCISCCGFEASKLVAVAVQQIAVEVEVTPRENEKSPWTLNSITIPAPRTKK